MKICSLNSQTKYIQNLIAKKKFTQLKSISGTYALADHTDGILSRKWIITEDRSFVDGENFVTLVVCNCHDGHAQKVRLDAIDSLIKNETLEVFQEREESLYCSHCIATKHLKQPAHISGESVATTEVISTKPFVAVTSAGSLGMGLIYAGHYQFKCQTCKQGKCPHLEVFEQWTGDYEERDSEEDSLARKFAEIKITREVKDDTFKCISKKGIPWPVTEEYKIKKDEVANSGFPDKLKPDIPSSKCPHGSQYVLSLIRNDAIIQREGNVKLVSLYQYITQTKCKCNIPYDGQKDLLLNLNNKHLFDLEWMFSIFDRTNCSSCPVMTAYKTAILARSRCIGPGELTYEQLRQAYNCFIR